jgi:Rps23 Pro-64 3,4-dihydroxylase Tpa1-like proline 4-hydroxylase
MFGNWIHDIPSLTQKFQAAEPFEHVILENFLQEDLAKALTVAFPTPEREKNIVWHQYDNPLEQKFACNDFENPGLSRYKSVFDRWQLEETVELFRQITGISDLEPDPFLHGAGIHTSPTRGKLDIHLDYSIHPLSGKERRLNLIYYLNETWDETWGGNLQLRDPSLTQIKEIPLKWNTAVLFRTCDISYHGFPEPMRCPPAEFRKSLAIYYVTPPRQEASHRFKAKFVPLPGQPVSDKLKKLYDIRPERRITENDLWEGWREEGEGYW